jgi:hypothetical protein
VYAAAAADQGDVVTTVQTPQGVQGCASAVVMQHLPATPGASLLDTTRHSSAVRSVTIHMLLQKPLQ